MTLPCVIAFAFIAVPVCPAPAAEVVLFSSLGANDSYNTDPAAAWWMFSNGFGAGSDGTQFAVRFTPSQTMPLSHVVIPVDIVNPGGFAVTIAITADGGGKPGDPFLSRVVGGLKQGDYFNSNAVLARFEPLAGNPIVLTAGENYWVRALFDSAPYMSGRWYASSFDNSSPTVGTTFLNYPTWTSQNSGRNVPALKVVGVIPEPASLGLLLPAGALLLPPRRRR